MHQPVQREATGRAPMAEVAVPRELFRAILEGIERLRLATSKSRANQKRLANLWSRQRITKKAHAGRGLETIWEIPV
jgi:hypothetical protein